jgi:hypothetical protein
MGKVFDEWLEQDIKQQKADAKETLERYKREYDKGDKSYLMHTVFVCMAHDVTVPQWAKSAFWSRLHARAEKAEAVFDRIEELRKTMPVDPALFERVGKEFHVSEATAKAIYYDAGVRARISDRNTDREVNELMHKELGPNPDEDSKDRWWLQSRAYEEISARWEAWSKNPTRTRKKRKR